LRTPLITLVKFGKLDASTVERGDCLPLFCFGSVRAPSVFLVLDVACPLAELTFLDVGCQAFAPWKLQQVHQLEVNVVGVFFVTICTLGLEEPVIIRLERNFGQIFQPRSHLQVKFHHLLLSVFY